MATRLFVCDTTGDELWEINPDGSNSPKAQAASSRQL